MESIKFLLSSDILELVTEPVQSLVEPVSIGSTGCLQVRRVSSSLDFIPINSRRETEVGGQLGGKWPR